MKVVNVSSLKNNPTEALRKAHEDMAEIKGTKLKGQYT